MPQNQDDKVSKRYVPKIAAGLDIGTTKICVLIASKDSPESNLKILGIGITESEGLNRGVVVNIDRTVKAIRNAVEQAEQQAGVKVEEVIVGIAGDHIESFQTRGIVSISNPTQEISKKDVDRLLEETRKIAISSERKIIHLIPQDFVIDGQDGIIDPIGMSGIRMEANVHVVTGLATAIQNIYRCVERAELKVKEIVLEPLASSRAVLTDEEKEVGVALVDIGGGTTDIAIFEESVIRYSAVFGIAGRQVTDDVRRGLGIIYQHAERIKRDYGHSYIPSILKDEPIMVSGVGGRKPLEITKNYLCQILQPRMEEIFEFVLAEIKHSGYENRLGAGVVITGGTTLLKGTEELALQVLGMPVKIGFPSGITYAGLAPEIENPIYSTVVGLTLCGMDLLEFRTEDMPDEVNEPASVPQEEFKQNVAIIEETTKAKEKVRESGKEGNKDDKPSMFSKIGKFLKDL